MIRPEELRVGIYVKYDGQEIKVDEAFMKTIMEAKDYEHLEGIPISKESLQKFGFEKKERINDFTIYSLESGVYVVAVSDDEDCFIFSRHTTRDQTQLEVFEYVHHFQNLYSSLTGEELQYKEGEPTSFDEALKLKMGEGKKNHSPNHYLGGGGPYKGKTTLH